MRTEILSVFVLISVATARPRRHAYRAAVVEKGRGNVGHQFIDVAWLFANHRNQLPTFQTKSEEPKKSRKILSRAKYSTRFGRPAKISHPTTDDEEIMSQLFASNLISRRNRIQTRRFQTRQRYRAAGRVLRTYKHILTNLPSTNNAWEGSGELW